MKLVYLIIQKMSTYKYTESTRKYKTGSSYSNKILYFIFQISLRASTTFEGVTNPLYSLLGQTKSIFAVP